MDLRKAARDPWVWGQVVLILVVAIAAPILPRHADLGGLNFALDRIGPLWLRVAGGVLALAGVALSMWGVRSLGPSLTPGTEPLPAVPLVTTGAYARVRHPIYTGLVLILAGYTLPGATGRSPCWSACSRASSSTPRPGRRSAGW